MKRCPRCDKTYPDSETFCEADGTALVSAGPAFSESAGNPGGGGAGDVIECPVCGGKAQPGELICNFCGARLGTESPAQAYTPPSVGSISPRTPQLARANFIADPSLSLPVRVLRNESGSLASPGSAARQHNPIPTLST